jgi:hypothetical protein
MRHATLLYRYPTSPHATVITWTEHGECNLPSSAPARKTERTPTPSHFIRRQKASKQARQAEAKIHRRITPPSYLHMPSKKSQSPWSSESHHQHAIFEAKRSEAQPNLSVCFAFSTPRSHDHQYPQKRESRRIDLMSKPEKSNEGKIGRRKRHQKTRPKNPALLTLPRCVVVVIPQHS